MKRKLILVALVCSIAFAVVIFTTAHSQVGTKNYTVKLYSAGKVVETWQSYQIGGGDRESITFYVGSLTYPRQVTISGTFSVEQTQ
ncbi:MAG: hypothetical protein WDA22_01020 [Bacteroidota bacterium]